MKTIFISSTFKDMQNERDILNRRMLPKINEIASKYNDSILLSDLRWGINTNEMDEESSNKKILEACLSEIDSCRPYMIVFLGERYGWMPGVDLMKDTIESHSLLELDDYNISVTELEILYGTFFNPSQFERTLFYFRNIEGTVPEYYSEPTSKGKEKLLDLKNRIKAIKGANIYDYNITWNKDENKWVGYDELADRICKDVENLMKSDWEEENKLSEYDKELKANFEYAEELAKQFYEYHSRVREANHLLDNRINLLGIVSDYSKILLSKLILDRKERGNFVLPIFCGLTKNSTSDIEVLKLIIKFLGKVCFGNDYDIDFNEFSVTLPILKKMLIEMYDLLDNEFKDKCVYIFVDSPELLDYDDIYNLPFHFDELGYNVNYILSSLSKTFIDNRFPSIRAVRYLDYFDANGIIKLLLSNTRKELDESVIREIFKKKDSKMRLYMELILKRLSLMDKKDYDEINLNGGDIKAIIDHQKKIVSQSSDYLEILCKEVIELSSKRINQILCKYAVLYISSSYYGISESSLVNIFNRKGLEWSSLDFKILMQYLSDIFLKDSLGNYRVKYDCLSNVFNSDEVIYNDLIEEFEFKTKDKELTKIDINEYINYIYYSKNYHKYIDLLINNKDKMDLIANGTYLMLKRVLDGYYHEGEKSDILITFINGVNDSLLNIEEKEMFLTYFCVDLKKALDKVKVFWRIMAYEVLKTWDRVNQIDSNEKNAIDCDIFNVYDLCERSIDRMDFLLREFVWEEGVRKEHLVPADLRKYEIKVGDNLFYFFDTPTKSDSTIFVMCNEYIVLKLYRLTSGDHCTYDLSYDEENNVLLVKEAEFMHYDVETEITTYRFNDPINKPFEYEKSIDTLKGNRNLRYYFKIK